MAYRFEFDSEHKILLAIVEGDIHGSDIAEMNKTLGQYAAKLNPTSGIGDFSGVTSFNVSSEAMRSAAQMPPAYKNPTPHFIVAPHDLTFGLLRMFQIIGEATRPKVQVVRSRAVAYAALGVENPRFEKVVLE
jgi:hypothetical protein